MKLFFAPPTDIWSQDTGYLKQWEDFFENLPRSGKNYTLESDASNADFMIIHRIYSRDKTGFLETFRPLTRRDVRTFCWDSRDLPTGRLSGFYSSLPNFLFDDRRHTAMSYPVPFNEMIEEFPRQDATIDFSFMGAMTAGVRTRIIEQFRDRQTLINAVVQDSGLNQWLWTTDLRSDMPAKQAFAELLRRSKFVLCPRGYGTGSFRLFETMQAGRVPVIISDAFVRPSGIDWDNCSLTVPEWRVAEIPALIRSRLDDWERLAANARAAWEANFAPETILDAIGANLVRMSANIEKTAFSRLGHPLRVGTSVIARKMRPAAGQLKRLYDSRRAS